MIEMLWKNAPVFAPRLKKAGDIWASDVDFSKYSPSDYTDSFAELQAYHSLSFQLEAFKSMGNTTDELCLLGSGINCTETDVRTGRKVPLI